MKGIHSLVVCFCALILASCASTVTGIKKDVDVALSPNEGYLMLQVNTNYDLREIKLRGKTNIVLTSEDLKSGSNYILANLPAGSYRIDSIRIGGYIFKHFDRELWSFRVQEGVISYVGHLNMQTRGNFYGVNSNIQLLNKSSFALEYLEENFANILSSRQVKYWGPGEDSFFETVNEDNGVSQ